MELKSSAPITAVQSSLRTAVAAASAVAIAQFLELEHPIYALISAVLVMDLSPLNTRQLAVHRFWGSLLGAVVGAVLSYPLPEGPVAIGVAILVAMLISYGLRMPAAAKPLSRNARAAALRMPSRRRSARCKRRFEN